VEWEEWIIVPIYKEGDKTYCINYRRISLLLTAYKILSNILLSRLTPHAEKIIVDFGATGQLLIIYPAFVIYVR
jgi:hypothetical protein